MPNAETRNEPPTIVEPSTSTPKRAREEPTSVEKSSSKKAKKSSEKKDEVSPMLKKLIRELKTKSSEVSPTIESDNTQKGNTTNFPYLYSKLINAEARNESTNREVIQSYYIFGQAYEERFEHYRKSNREHKAQRLLNEEIRKQFTGNITDTNFWKKIEKARKIYDLFSSI
ncbi:6584_t:CDS:1, partial [Acaulospora colombiana]